MVEDKEFADLEKWFKEHDDKWRFLIKLDDKIPHLLIESKDSLISYFKEITDIKDMRITKSNNFEIRKKPSGLALFFKFGAIDIIG